MLLITLIILTALVSVHEYGHYLAAKRCGVLVEEFSIGMGPAIYQRRGKETTFSIRCLPIGGYCKMVGEGEDDESDEEDDEEDELLSRYTPEQIEAGDFRKKNKRQRALILSAGVLMNFITGFFLILITYILIAFMTGLSVGDVFRLTWNYFLKCFFLIFESLRMLFTGEASPKDLAGPIGMVSMVQEIYSYGWVNLLAFAAFISINLGVVNLIPIPALDGGQLFILAIEGITRRPVSDRIKNALTGVSFVLLMALMIFVAYNDIIRLVN